MSPATQAIIDVVTLDFLDGLPTFDKWCFAVYVGLMVLAMKGYM